jgi:hypothetical protein
MLDYSKVHGSYSDIDTLIYKILSDTKKLAVKVDKTTSLDDEKFSINIYSNIKFGSSIVNLNEAAGNFISFQIFIDVLLLSPALTNKHGMEKVAQMCREYYQGNLAQLKIIDDFERYYKPEDAVSWYIRDCFLFRILTKAFRDFNLASLFAIRFFIVDLYTQLNKLCIEQNKELKECITLYRGQVLHANELESLKKNVGHQHLLKLH